jgi:hypothetical protein
MDRFLAGSEKKEREIREGNGSCGMFWRAVAKVENREKKKTK